MKSASKPKFFQQQKFSKQAIKLQNYCMILYNAYKKNPK